MTKNIQEQKKYNICTECGASDSCKEVDWEEYKNIKTKFQLVGFEQENTSICGHATCNASHNGKPHTQAQCANSIECCHNKPKETESSESSVVEEDLRDVLTEELHTVLELAKQMQPNNDAEFIAVALPNLHVRMFHYIEKALHLAETRAKRERDIEWTANLRHMKQYDLQEGTFVTSEMVATVIRDLNELT